MRLITSTHYNRPSCTRLMIENLLKCENIQYYHVCFFIEPGCPEVSKIIEEYPYGKTVHHNTRLLGCWENKKQAVNHGMENTDFLIHLEDDVILAKDALLFFEWANKNRQDDIATVTAYEKCTIKEYVQLQNLPNQVNKRVWYNSTAWAIWKDRFELVKDWNGQDKDLMNKLHKIYNMHEMFPCLSRANNIGYINGESCPAQQMLDLVGELAHAPIGRSRTGNKFVENKENYKQVLLKNSNVNSEIIQLQLSKCDKYDFDNQLITNELNQEFVKLNDTTFKSRDNEDYKKKYYLDFWAGEFDFLIEDFVWS